jgi:hypothetical protein
MSSSGVGRGAPLGIFHQSINNFCFFAFLFDGIPSNPWGGLVGGGLTFVFLDV